MASLETSGSSARGAVRPGRFWLGLLKLVLLAILVTGSAWLLLTHREWFDNPRMVKAQVMSWGVWGPLVFVVLYTVGPSFLVPGAVMTVAGGLAFGALWGSVYSLLGADIGAMVAFGAGRFLGKSFVERTVGERFETVVQGIARQGFRIIFYLRIVPVIPYNALNLLAGASPIGFRDYFWASMLGMIPGTLVFAFLGDALWEPLSFRFLLALVMLSLVVAGGELYRRLSAIKTGL